MENKKIINIDKNTAIYADRYQYIAISNSSSSFFGSLTECFKFLFEEKVKEKLIDEVQSNMQEVIKIHKEVETWLKEILKGTEEPKFKEQPNL